MTTMTIKKMLRKLDDYFNLPQKKQNEKHDKLVKIITKLERKKFELKAKMMVESEKDTTTEMYHDLQKELKVVSKMLKKARKHIVLKVAV